MTPNPRKLPPGVIETDPPDEESRYGRELGTNAKVTWSWLKSRFKGFSPEADHDRDYWNGKWGRLYIEVRPFNADGKWLDNLYQEFTSDALRAAQDYGFGLMHDMPEVDGFWVEAVVDKYWTLKGERRWMRVMTLGRYERARGTMARNTTHVFGSAAHKQQLALDVLADGMGHVTNARDGLHTAFKALARQGKITMLPLERGDWMVKLKSHQPNSSSYYVWVVAHDGTPLASEGPYGPHPLEKAKQLARIGATEGVHDRVVSLGRSPTSSGFKIERRYRKGTGERVI